MSISVAWQPATYHDANASNDKCGHYVVSNENGVIAEPVDLEKWLGDNCVMKNELRGVR